MSKWRIGDELINKKAPYMGPYKVRIENIKVLHNKDHLYLVRVIEVVEGFTYEGELGSIASILNCRGWELSKGSTIRNKISDELDRILK